MKTRSICLLTCEDLVNHPDGAVAADDDYLVRELEANGFKVEQIAWNRYVPAQRSDEAVIVRTTWDYVSRCQEFLAKLEEIERSGVRLYNPYSMIKWNAHKGYLRDLSTQGVPVVETYYLRPSDSIQEAEYAIQKWNTEAWIFKPAVSATSYGLSRVKRFELAAALLQAQASGQDHLIQPFMPEILSGEVSLQFFGKRYSHAILKKAGEGDFRVQSAYGGTWTAYSPSIAEVEFCGNVLSLIPDPLLVARVDFIPTAQGPKLMELELIEPALYFASSPEAAPKNFVAALLQYLSVSR